MTKLGEQVKISQELVNGIVKPVIYINDVELEGVLWTRVFFHENDKSIPSGLVRLNLEVYAKMI